MKKLKNALFILPILVIALIANVYGAVTNNTNVYAYSDTNNLEYETVSLRNSYFNNSPNSTSLETDPNGWTMIKTSSPATSGVINIDKTNGRFASSNSTYNLEATENPWKESSEFDDKILMINSKNSSGTQTAVSQGYRSDKINFSAYSFYEIRVWAYTMNNASASMYLTDLAGNLSETNKDFVKFENVSTNGRWAEYTFYVQTGYSSQTTELELYLGATDSRTSVGIAFFDNIDVLKVSSNKYFDDINNEQNPDRFNQITFDINYITDYQTADYNFDFETGSTIGTWTVDGQFVAQKTIGKVMNLSTNSEMNTNDLTYCGTDRTYGNKYALVLSTSEAGHIGYKSQPITIDQYGIYKISVNVHADLTSGNAYFKISENNDVNLFYGEDFDFYSPISNEITISTSSSDKLKNNYSTVSFYVVGHPLYNSSVNVELWLGKESGDAIGTVVFDSLTVEQLSFEEYDVFSSSSTNVSVKLTTITGNPSIENGYFNSVSGQTIDKTFPLKANGWEQTTAYSENSNIWGVVNTNADAWDKNGLSIINPRNPALNYNGTYIPIQITDTNNILMIQNKNQSYQTLTGPTFNVTKNSYYTLTFNYLTLNYISGGNPILNFYIIDSDKKVLFEEKNLNSSSWELYTLTIKTEHYSSELQIMLEVGTETLNASGVVYMDNIILNTVKYTNEEFEDIISSNNDNILDMSNIGMHIKSQDLNAHNVYEALMFQSELEVGTESDDDSFIAFGGVIDENNAYGLSFPETNTNQIKNMLCISTFGKATYSLTSKYTITLSSGTYYKLSIFIKTDFFDAHQLQNDDDNNVTYGAEFSLDGVPGASIIALKPNDDFVEYVMYVQVKTDTETKIRFALSSEGPLTAGNAFFDTFSFSEVSSTEYDQAKGSDTVLVFSTVGDNNEPNDNPKPDDDKEPVNIWIIISSMMIAFAIIIALVGFFIRKIEFKKFKKVRTETVYDRSKTVSRDAVIKEAEKRRDEDIKVVKGEIAELNKYLDELEVDNKERIAKQREKNSQTITRQSEREFKQYVNTRSKVMKDIDKLELKIKEMNTPEYLLRLEQIVKMEKANEEKTNEQKSDKKQVKEISSEKQEKEEKQKEEKEEK